MSGELTPLKIRNTDASAMGFLPTGLGAELEGLPHRRRQGSTAFLAALRLRRVTRLGAAGAQLQPEALEYGATTGALRVLAEGTERALIRERTIQPRRLLPRDDRRRVECTFWQAADLDNP